eukprot:TRINITY_DN3202_c1_g1_i11.p1 TRINITY_DN3202_c1_g1~~TRINITY_DN3202_c1_g1_i11.p1  ORF type:complete len:381 (-),score=-1.65 TRINITY_DN3202_c1_g1_i11:190-1302(-)
MEGIYCPKGMKQHWYTLNSKFLIRGDKVSTMGEGLVIPREVSILILEQKGFLGLDDIRDNEWLGKMALTCDEQKLFHPVDAEFGAMVDKFIEREVMRSLIERAEKTLELLRDGAFERIITNAKKRRKVIRDYGALRRRGLANGLLGLVVAPCMICLENKTKGMRVTSCCGQPLHAECFNEWRKVPAKGVTCPLCKQRIGIVKEITIEDKDRLFVKPDAEITEEMKQRSAKVKQDIEEGEKFKGDSAKIGRSFLEQCERLGISPDEVFSQLSGMHEERMKDSNPNMRARSVMSDLASQLNRFGVESQASIPPSPALTQASIPASPALAGHIGKKQRLMVNYYLLFIYNIIQGRKPIPRTPFSSVQEGRSPQ